MPTKTLTKTQKSISAAKALPSIPKELIDQFVSGPMSAQAVNAASVAFKKALIEHCLGTRLLRTSASSEESRSALDR